VLTNTIQMQISQRMQARIAELKLTNKELVYRSGLHSDTVAKFRRRRAPYNKDLINPYSKSVQGIAKALEWTPEMLVYGRPFVSDRITELTNELRELYSLVTHVDAEKIQIKFAVK